MLGKRLTAAFLQDDNDKIAEAQQNVAKLQRNRELLEQCLRVCFAQDRLQRSMSTGKAVGK
eukprot:159133-Hanusia_phi.AAC.2